MTDAAGDAEQSGQHAGNHAADDKGQREPENLVQGDAEEHSTLYIVNPEERLRVRPK